MRKEQGSPRSSRRILRNVECGQQGRQLLLKLFIDRRGWRNFGRVHHRSLLRRILQEEASHELKEVVPLEM